MMTSLRGAAALLSIACLAAGVSCGPPDDPEIVALSYVRAMSSGDPDTAVQLLDIGEITARVEQQIVVVDSTGRETFLEDSIESLLWGLFRETRPADFVYDATPAEIDGGAARVSVTKTPPEGDPERVVVHLSRTDEGWRVSGDSLDSLVTFVVQRLQEKY